MRKRGIARETKKRLEGTQNVFIQRVHSLSEFTELIRCTSNRQTFSEKLERIQQGRVERGSRWGKGWTKTSPVTFNLGGRTRLTSLSLSRFARIYLLQQTALHLSRIYYHISRRRLENSQIYERTSGQINTVAPRRSPSSASAEFLQRQDAKWTDIIRAPHPSNSKRTLVPVASGWKNGWRSSRNLFESGSFDRSREIFFFKDVEWTIFEFIDGICYRCFECLRVFMATIVREF